LLGVNNINDLVECTRVLPLATDKFTVQDDKNSITNWLNGGGSKSISTDIENGKKVGPNAK